MVRRIGLMGFLFGLSHLLFAQSVNLFEEKVLDDLFKRIQSETSYSRRDSLNTIFYDSLKIVLGHRDSYSYPFDSLYIGKLRSSDDKFRIFTWNIPQPGGYQNYFGLMQVKTGSNKIKLVELRDGRDKIKDPKNEQLNANIWMAALYYQLTEFTVGGQKVYLLLGFDFNNLFTSKKIVEVLTFDNDDNPIFGFPIFNVDGKYNLSRIVFEFNTRASIVLKFLDDRKMLVFDHLSPSSPEFTGDFQYYGPDGSFDGFKFDGIKWMYVRDLDLRNPNRPKAKPTWAPEEIKDPGFLYRPSTIKE